MRFDEVELDAVPLGGLTEPEEAAVIPSRAGRFKRSMALLTDLSLFAALLLILWPLAESAGWVPAVALTGFTLIVSYYYFVGCWMLWGRTVGGVIFDVYVLTANGESLPLRHATLRWVGLLLSLGTLGAGFLPALMPSEASLADRLSATRSVAG